MEPSSPPPPEQAVSGIMARLEQAMAGAGERLLVDQLHRALDEEGSAALAALSDTLLPLVQALIIVLPQAVAEGISPGVLSAARTLGLALREQHVARPELVAEGVRVHERLLREIAADLRAEDRALVAGMLRISRVILEMESAVLLAYEEGGEAAPPPAAAEDHDEASE